MAVISWTDPYDLGTAYINIASTTVNATLTNATHTITLPAVQLKANLKYFTGPKVRYQLLTDAVNTGWTAYVANNTYASASWNSYSITTSSYFNSSNPTVKTASKKINVYELTAYESGESQATTGFDPPSTKTVVTINLTLNAPPVLTNATIKSSTASGIYWTEDSEGVYNSRIIVNGATTQYGGTISEATLTVGTLSTTVTGTAYISMPIVGLEAGTYSPVYTVTDSRGQTSTKTFDPIEVKQYERVTYDITQIQSDTDGFWLGVSTASTTISNIVAPEGVTLVEADLIFRSDSVAKKVVKSLDGTETSIFISSKTLIDAVGVGTFTPDVYIKDSRGIWEHNYLDPIVIRQYTNTSLGSATLIRTNQNGIQDDEGAYGLLTINVNYTYQLGDLLEPIVDVTDSSATSSGIVTWYESWNSTTGIDTSSLIDWTDYNPTSPVTLYGLISGYGSTTGFDTQRSFQIAVTARDTQTSSDTLTQTLDSAFYTIDFLAGGHGIAFGQPSLQDGFECNMPTTFHDTVGCEDTLTAPDMTTQEVSDFVDSLDLVVPSSATSETITRNDLKAVLNEVLPIEPASYVIESGYSGRWFYKKWSDGSADCWCYTASESIACTSQWGSAYYSAQKTYSLPTGLFIPYPVITATLFDGGGLGWVTIVTWSESSVTVYVSEPTSTTRNMEICFHVYGKWK